MTLRYDRDLDTIMINDGEARELKDDILELVKREIAAERNACAKIADHYGEPTIADLQVQMDTAHTIAAAIRARGETKE